MNCENCGAEVKENAKFCGRCGAPVGTAEPESAEQTVNAEPPVTVQQQSFNETVIKANSIISECKGIAVKFFTKNPFAAVEDGIRSKANLWIAFLIINTLLFAFTSCLNVSQIIGYALDKVMEFVQSMATSIGGGVGGAAVASYLPETNIGILWRMFLPVAVIAVILFACEFIAMKIAAKVENGISVKNTELLNAVGVSLLPVSTALVINVIAGLIYPPLTLFVLTAGVLVNMVLIYESLRYLSGSFNAPVKGFIVIAAIFCLFAAIAFAAVAHYAGEALEDSIMRSVGSAVSGGIDSVLGSMFDF